MAEKGVSKKKRKRANEKISGKLANPSKLISPKRGHALIDYQFNGRKTFCQAKKKSKNSIKKIADSDSKDLKPTN